MEQDKDDDSLFEIGYDGSITEGEVENSTYRNDSFDDGDYILKEANLDQLEEVVGDNSSEIAFSLNMKESEAKQKLLSEFEADKVKYIAQSTHDIRVIDAYNNGYIWDFICTNDMKKPVNSILLP